MTPIYLHATIALPAMALAILQTVLLVFGTGALYVLWQREVRPARLGWIVTLGLLGRAVAGQVLFWISWLQLPVAETLQSGHGLWFFALDAGHYVPAAFSAADQGMGAILLHSRNVASVTFVQVLALFSLAFGKVVSVALLLNLGAFLGICVIVLRCSRAAERDGEGTVLWARGIALAAVSLAPSSVLWSLQPLKDVLNQFLFVAFLAAAMLWQKSWREDEHRGRRIAAASLAMIVSLFAIAGIRWYFAFILLVASLVFLALTALASQRKVAACASAVLLFVALTQALRVGAAAYVPVKLQPALHPRTAFHEVAEVPGLLLSFTETAREGFERQGGATTIRGRSTPSVAGGTVEQPTHLATKPVGEALSSGPAQVAVGGRNEADRKPPATAFREPRARARPHPAGSAPPPVVVSNEPTTPQPATMTPAAESDTSAVAPSGPGLPTPAPSTVAVSARTDENPEAQSAASSAPPVAAPTSERAGRSDSGRPEEETATKVLIPVTPAAVPPIAAPRAEPPVRSDSGRPEKETATKAPVPAPPPAGPTEASSKPSSADEGEVAAADLFALPESKSDRFLLGMAALTIPRTVGHAMGLFEIGGGKGLMWFTDLDTLVFDLVLITSAILLLVRFRRAGLRNGAFWLIILTAGALLIALVYTVTNFGTLFRLRAMVFTAIALAPLALFAAPWDHVARRRPLGENSEALVERETTTVVHEVH